jgi:hypothetical protein
LILEPAPPPVSLSDVSDEFPLYGAPMSEPQPKQPRAAPTHHVVPTRASGSSDMVSLSEPAAGRAPRRS